MVCVTGRVYLHIADLPGLLQNALVDYADDSTPFCRILYPRDRASLAASSIDDLAAHRAGQYLNTLYLNTFTVFIRCI